MASSLHLHGPLAASLASESREYRWIYAASLPVFLVATAIARLSPRRPRAGRDSLLGEARATAHTIIPFAFMR